MEPFNASAWIDTSWLFVLFDRVLEYYFEVLQWLPATVPRFCDTRQNCRKSYPVLLQELFKRRSIMFVKEIVLM